MWFPTHIRRSGTYYSVVISMVVFGSLLQCGCSSFPRLDPPAIARQADNAQRATPIPVFDDPNPAVQIADVNPGRGSVAAPKPFRWEELGTSAGGRSIEGVSVGHGGYRTLILGSLSGDDPLAIALTEEFARRIHENSIILGGIEATIIRSPNPDGLVLHQAENGNGVMLNRQFPSRSAVASAESADEPEIKLIRKMLDEQRPQRVIHVRTYVRAQGVIAASSGASAVAEDIAEWLGLEFLLLPGRSQEGTLERYLSEQAASEIITFAFPADSDRSTLWETYGDSLLNLLLDEDYETRKLARTNRPRSSADRRGRRGKPGFAEDSDVPGSDTVSE